MKSKIIRASLLLTVLAALIPAGVILHELGHYLSALVVYGVQGNIELVMSYPAVASFVFSGNVGTWVSLMGGIFSGLVLFSLLFIKDLPLSLRLAILSLSLFELFGGLLEGYANQAYVTQDIVIWSIIGGIILMVNLVYLNLYDSEARYGEVI